MCFEKRLLSATVLGIKAAEPITSRRERGALEAWRAASLEPDSSLPRGETAARLVTHGGGLGVLGGGGGGGGAGGWRPCFGPCGRSLWRQLVKDSRGPPVVFTRYQLLPVF